jgi:hypothetical protein
LGEQEEMTQGICADPIKELERRKKQSEAMKRRAPISEETRRKLREAQKLRAPPSEETRRKMSKSIKNAKKQQRN